MRPEGQRCFTARRGGAASVEASRLLFYYEETGVGMQAELSCGARQHGTGSPLHPGAA